MSNGRTITMTIIIRVNWRVFFLIFENNRLLNDIILII